MTPPGGSNGNNNGPGRFGRLLPFRRSSSAATAAEVTPSESLPPIEAAPASRPQASSRPAPATAHISYYDFTTLMRGVPNLNLQGATGQFSRIQTYLDFLANPSPNGGHEVEFIRDGKSYSFRQAQRGGDIQLLHTEELRTRGNTERRMTPVYALTYHPDGSISHSANFDANGQALPGQRRTLSQPGAHRSDHSFTMQFLEARLSRLGQGRSAFNRLETPLIRIRGRADAGSRSIWHDNLLVLNNKVYTLRTQNLSFLEAGSIPSQKQIIILENQGNRQVEILRISETGEIAHNPQDTVRRSPSVEELSLLKQITRQVQAARETPAPYQERLATQLKSVAERRAINNPSAESPVELRVPRIEIISVDPAPKTTRGPFGEWIIDTSNGRELWRDVRPLWPFSARSHRWQNPADSNDVRWLRPRGVIRRNMLWELGRWIKHAMVYGTVNNTTYKAPPAGSVKLHLSPDGSSQLDIHRDYDVRLRNGNWAKENSLYNIIHRSANGEVTNLNSIIRRLVKQNPSIRDLPRLEQLDLANRTLTNTNAASASLSLQIIPEIPIQNLADQGAITGPAATAKLKSASGALEILQSLPQLRGLTPQVRGELRNAGAIGQAVGIAPENFFEIHYPGSNPPTSIQIREEVRPNNGKRVVVSLWQTGHSTATAVYDNGVLNPPESIRANEASIHRAQQGHHRLHWLKRGAMGFARFRTYYSLNGGTYFLSHFASLPFSWLFERAAYTQGMRETIGTPVPNLQTMGNEMVVAGAMLTGAGSGTILVDSTFNYLNGMGSVMREMRQSGTSFTQAYRHHSPRFLNPPPLRARPIPKQMFYARNFLQRSIPLLGGLIMADMAHRGSFRPRFDGEIMTAAGRIGLVSGVSSLAWAGVQRRLEGQLARNATVRGSNFLLRHNILTEAAVPIGRSRFALTWRASFATIILEMAALRVWDSYDRRQQLLAQEGSFRSDLSRAIDQRNRLMSRLELHEDVSPTRLIGAQQAVQGAYTRYRRYLEIIERNGNGNQGNPPSISLNNAYGDVRQNYNTQYQLLTNGNASPAINSQLLRAQITRDQGLLDLRTQDRHFEERIDSLYESHNMPTNDGDEEGLRDFLARMTSLIEDNPEIIDDIAANPPTAAAPNGTPASAPPVSLESAQGRAIINQMRWKSSRDPEFMLSNRDNQAQWILQEFTGYRITEEDGTRRPWNQGEALAFLTALDAENTRRANNLEETLLTPTGGQQANPELERLAQEEERIYREEMGSSQHELLIRTDLGNTIAALETQMNQYERRIQQRTDRAILYFAPENHVADTPPH